MKKRKATHYFLVRMLFLVRNVKTKKAYFEEKYKVFSSETYENALRKAYKDAQEEELVFQYQGAFPGERHDFKGIICIGRVYDRMRDGAELCHSYFPVMKRSLLTAYILPPQKLLQEARKEDRRCDCCSPVNAKAKNNSRRPRLLN